MTLQGLKQWIALICLLLTLGSAAAVVAHHHANASESGQCAVCAAVHAPASTQVAQQASVVAMWSPVLAAPRPAPRQPIIAFALSVRPPPAT